MRSVACTRNEGGGGGVVGGDEGLDPMLGYEPSNSRWRT
jgi:hypothetical protein